MASKVKPQMLVCYLCGQQFGSTSLVIHQPQCYQKHLTWWTQGDPATRGPKPKDPAVHGHKSQDAMSQKEMQEFNDGQFEAYKGNLAPCDNCGRTFLPERLVVHQRSCNKGRGSTPGGHGKPQSERAPSEEGSGGKRQPGTRPNMLVCNLCGQQFGTASLPIHQPKCYEKHLVWWQQGDPATRGPKPKDPTKGPSPSGMSVDEYNDEQFRQYKENLSPCPHCARTFNPQALQIHLRSCGKGAGTPASNSDSDASPKPPRSSGRVPGQRPNMLVCYLCGQQFGTSSLGIHQPQCYRKKMAEWERGDPSTRGSRPKDPATVDTSVPVDVEEFNNQQFDLHNANLPACENCGRTFAPDRLAVHKRSCHPGASGRGSKPVTSSPAPSRGPVTPVAKRSPLVNRLPNPAQQAQPRQCGQCGCAEHDGDACFCEECGGRLPEAAPSATPSSPAALLHCAPCNRSYPGGRFCQECGGPLKAAATNPAPPAPPAELTCGSCGWCNGDGARFCEECGAGLAEPPSPSDRRSPLRNRLPSGSSTASGPPNDAARWMTESQAPHDLPSVRTVVDEEEHSMPSGNAPAQAHPPDDAGGYGDLDALDSTVPAMDMAPCNICGRQFIVNRLEKHRAICAKSSKKQRKVFNASKARLPEEALSMQQGGGKQQQQPAKGAKSDWKSKSSALRDAMRSAREVSDAIKSGKPLPPPTYTKEEQDDRVPCPHCGRKFAEETAERHIPKCATTMNRPNGPPRSVKHTSVPSPAQPKAKGNRTTSVPRDSPGMRSPTSDVPPDVARMGVSPEKWHSMQEKKNAEWDDAFGEAPKDLHNCPHCDRKFVPKSLEIHLKSCGGRHGTSKKSSSTKHT